MPTDVLICKIIIDLFVFIFGTVIGSFLNVVVYRTPLHQSIVKGSSHCMTCNTPIKKYDMIPVLSWLFLGGKCRACKAKISPRYMLVEFMTGCLFLTAYLKFGLSIKLATTLVFFAILVVISFIDIDTMEIPYWCTITIAVLGGISFFTESGMPWWERLLGAVIIAVPFAILAIFGGMGGGDVQLMAASGLLLGWKIVPAAAIGVLLGAIYGVIHKICVNKEEKAYTQKVSDEFSSWLSTLAESGNAMKQGAKDTIVGSVEKGKAIVEWDLFEEKAWDIVPKETDLEEKLSQTLSDQNECVFRICVKDNKVTSAKYAQRIVFGPFLSIGLVAGMLVGEQIIQWYMSLM